MRQDSCCGAPAAVAIYGKKDEQRPGHVPLHNPGLPIAFSYQSPRVTLGFRANASHMQTFHVLYSR